MSDTPVIVVISTIVVVVILLAMLAIVGLWQTPGKGPLGPSKGDYRPLPEAEGRRPIPTLPKAPRGRDAGSP